MSILSLSLNNQTLKDSVLNRETAVPFREPSAVRETEKRPSDQDLVRGPSKGDDKDSGFRKIFNEKKAERDNAGDSKARTTEGAAKPAFVVKGDSKKENAEKPTAIKAKLGAGAKTPTLKDILAALIEKNSQARETPKAAEKRPEKQDKKAPLIHGERTLTLRERLENAVKNKHEIVTIQSLVKKADRQQNVKTAMVVDLREKPAEKAKPSTVASKSVVKKTAGDDATAEAKKTGDGKERLEVRMYARAPAPTEPAEYAGRTRPAEAASAKTDISSRLTDVMKNEMVRHSGIVVKDGGAGEIHLVLKPESLGSVRVKLNLEDNHIVGKIIVDNETVKAIIKENLGDLETALQEKGYESASLNVFVAGEHHQAPDTEGEFERLVRSGAETGALVSDEYESGGVGIYDDALVNIVL